MENIATFHKEASDSEFDPRVQSIGVSICVFLISIISSLMIIVSIASIFMPVLTTMIIAILIPSIVVGAIMSLCSFSLIKQERQSFLNSITAGSAIDIFFAKNGNKLATYNSKTYNNEQQSSKDDPNNQMADNSSDVLLSIGFTR